jgi:hypothetical protein
MMPEIILAVFEMYLSFIVATYFHTNTNNIQTQTISLLRSEASLFDYLENGNW